MTRLTLAALALAPALLLQAEEPAAPNPGQIAEWMKQLGSEEYNVRQAAFEKLKTAGEPAVELLKKAAKESEDPEVRSNAKALLPFVRANMLRRNWQSVVQEKWIPGLKEGRIAGPALGLAPDLVPQEPDQGPIKLPDNRCKSAVDESLKWLALCQDAGGHWDALAHGAGYHADVDQTALALLAILGSGHTEKVGAHTQSVRRAVDWLIKRQREDGAILNDGWGEVDGLTHAVAGLALAEAAGMARNPGTILAAQKAADYSTNRHQSEKDGAKEGFGRLAKSATPDLFTSAFFTMQLVSAKVAGLKVEPAAFDGLVKFLDSVDAKNVKEGGFYCYVPGGKATPEATLTGCLARQFLGWKKEDLTAQVSAAIKAFKGPTAGEPESDFVANYFGTLAAFQQGGVVWTDWNDRLKRGLLDAQNAGGNLNGSWNGSGRWSGAGRTFATTLNALCFQVYYGSRPLRR